MTKNSTTTLYSTVQLEDAIWSLQVSNNDEPYYQVSYSDKLEHSIQFLINNTNAKVILVVGGERYFSAGASREALLNTEPWSFFKTSRLIASLPIPTIALMAGHAIGGGFVMGLWCDIPILAEESLYGANFMAVGLTPGMGATAIIPEILGDPLGNELLFTGQLLKGRDFIDRHTALAHTVYPKAQLTNRGMAMAREMAGMSRESLVLLKRQRSIHRLALLDKTLEQEQTMQQILFSQVAVHAQINQRYPKGASRQ